MKKMIMALVCATMSLTMMAQPKDKKDNDRQPRMEQAAPQQGCPMQQQQGQCPMMQGQQGCPMQGQSPMMQGQGPMMQQKAPGDISILKKIGVDSTKIKKVKEMKLENRKALQELKEKNRKAEQELKEKNRKAEQEMREDYNKNLRKLLGDDTYIQYLEAKVAQQQANAKNQMSQGKNRMPKFRMGMRRGMNRMGQQGKKPMGPGMQPGKNKPGKDQLQKGDKKDNKDNKDKKDNKNKNDRKNKKSKKSDK